MNTMLANAFNIDGTTVVIVLGPIVVMIADLCWNGNFYGTKENSASWLAIKKEVAISVQVYYHINFCEMGHMLHVDQQNPW